MATFGSDFSGVLDVDNVLSTVSGRLGVAQAVARRWLTPQGGLFYDDTYGGGILELLNAANPDISTLAQRLEQQALLDERVEDCTVSVEFVDQTLTIDGQLVDADGPFTLTLTVSEMASTGDGTLPAVELFVEAA